MAADDKDESMKTAQPADKPSSEKTPPQAETQIPGIKPPAFVRGEWKRELTPEEIEKKQKRSEAAKRAAETRRRKRLEAEAAARAVIPEAEVAVRAVKPAVQQEEWQPQQIKWDEPEKKLVQPAGEEAPPAEAPSVETPKKTSAKKGKGLPEQAPALKKAKEQILAAAAKKEITPPQAAAPVRQEEKQPAQTAEKALRQPQAKQAEAEKKASAPGKALKKTRMDKAALPASAGKAAEKKPAVQNAVEAVPDEPNKNDTPKPPQKPGVDAETSAEPSAAVVFLKKSGAFCKKAAKKTAICCKAAAKKTAALCKKAGRGIAAGWRAFLKKAKPVCKRFARWCRKGYRFIRLKLHPVMVRLGAVFYKIGFRTEYILVLCWRWIKAEALKTAHFAWNVCRCAAKPFVSFFKGLWEMVSAPFCRLYSGFSNMVRAYRDVRPQGRKKAFAEAAKHIGRGIRSYHHLVGNLLMWGVAAAALVLFITTVNATLNQQYVLQVMVEGKSVGFVKSEEVFDKAYENVQGQIIYTQEDDEKWNIKPEYHLVRQGDVTVSNEVDVTESILRNSGEELSQATGLYVDGVFYGAVRDTAALNQTFEALKAPYQAQYPGASIQFVQDVQMKDGLYLTKSLTDEQQLCDMLASETEGTGIYIIQSGDTLSGIAGTYGVSQNELFQLNPQLENGNATYYPGDQLVVSMAKHFLQVKAIVTSVEEESIAYTTEARENADKLWNAFTVLQEGENGTKDVTYQRTYIDGNMIEEIKLGENITKEPVTRITERGTKTPDNKPIVLGSGWIFPVPNNHGLSRGFSGSHPALDIQAPYGSAIMASRGGVVVKATFAAAGYGWHVAINHGDGYYSLYAHCSSLAVSVGQSVSQGDIIGYVGSTGWSTGNHCHFEIRIGGLGGWYKGCVDPAPYVM